MKAIVRELLRQIQSLNDEDRVQLDLELAKRRDREWERETKKAHKMARAKGITQDTIDRIIEHHRYGR